MKRIFAVFVAAAVIAMVLPAVGQECSIHTITGTYMFRGIGQSFVGGAPYPLSTTPNPAAGVLPLHATGAFLAGSHVGTITVHPDYTVETRSWIAMGPYRTDPAGMLAPATITSIGLEKTADGMVLGCGGTLQYPGLPGTPDSVDKFITWDNGNEVRFVHTAANSPTTSIFVAKRVTRAFDPAPRCGAQTMTGTYVATCNGSLLFLGPQTLSTAAMFHLNMTGGEINGNLFNRIESQSSVVPVKGQVTVDPDCTGTGYLYMPGLLPHPQAKMLYSLATYDNGKGAFLMPLEIELPNSTRIPYFSSMSCQLERAMP